jgi:hypothetical protein
MKKMFNIMLGKLVSRLIFNLTPGHLAALFGLILADIINGSHPAIPYYWSRPLTVSTSWMKLFFKPKISLKILTVTAYFSTLSTTLTWNSVQDLQSYICILLFMSLLCKYARRSQQFYTLITDRLKLSIKSFSLLRRYFATFTTIIRRL